MVIKLTGHATHLEKNTQFLFFAVMYHTETRTNLHGFAYTEATHTLFDFLKFSEICWDSTSLSSIYKTISKLSAYLFFMLNPVSYESVLRVFQKEL